MKLAFKGVIRKNEKKKTVKIDKLENRQNKEIREKNIFDTLHCFLPIYLFIS